MKTGTWNSSKAHRILDATRELLLRRGSRAVTISEVARLARIGKGTVYLYWETKEDLLVELFARDFLALLDEVVATVTAEPRKIVPHELFPLMQRTIRTHPFVVAIQAKDLELLGLLDGHPAIRELMRTVGPAAVLTQLLPVLREHGVVRTDLPVEAQIYAATAVLQGFFELPNALPSAEVLHRAVDDADQVLGEVSRLLLEPVEPVSAAAVAVAASSALAKIDQARQAALTTFVRTDADITNKAG